jgi:predicted kinase
VATLYIIQGFLGAGKTTFSIRLARRKNAVHLNADDYCAAHFSAEQQNDQWDACYSQAVTTLWREAERRLENGRDVVLDFGFWSQSSRDDARLRAERFGVNLQHYYVFAPDDVLLARIKARSGDIADKNIRNFHVLKQLFDEPSEDEQAIVISTG